MKFIRDQGEKFLFFVTGFSILLAVILLYHNPIRIFEEINFKLYDTLVAQLQPNAISKNVTIIDIDDRTLQHYGQWPWPRYQLAGLLKKLQDMQVKAVGIDFVFPEADQTSLKNIQQNLLSTFNVALTLDTIPDYLLDNDAHLAEVLSSGPFVLGYTFQFNKISPDKTRRTTNSPAKIVQNINFMTRFTEDAQINDVAWFKASQVVNNIPQLANTVSSSGFFNIELEHDGVIRKVPMVIKFQDRLYPSLSLATLMMAHQSQQLLVNISNNGVESLLFDETIIPLDQQGNLWIHFHHSDQKTLPVISAIDILNGSISAETLADQIVLVGSSAQGLQDLRSTPYDAVFPGVKVHARIIDNILRGDFINQPKWLKDYELLTIIVFALISMFIIARLCALSSLFINILLMGLLLFLSFYTLLQNNYLSVLYPLLVILFNISILYVLLYRFKEKNLIKQTLELNKIQHSAIKMLKHSNIELEENKLGLKQKIEDSRRQLTSAFARLDRFNKDISDSIQYGACIQQSLLPQSDEFEKTFSDSFVIWEPRDKVGGDIYFFFEMNNIKVIAVIDCTGHGIPGALLSMIAISSLTKIVMLDKCYRPGSILQQLNYLVKTTLGQAQANAISDDGLEISLCVIDLTTQQLHYAGAGLPLIYIQNNKLQLIKGERHKIGYKQSVRSDINHIFQEHTIELNQPTRCYLFTDGLIDQPGGVKNLPLGKKRLIQFLQENHQLSFKSQQQRLVAMFTRYQAEQIRRDDITLLGFLIDG